MRTLFVFLLLVLCLPMVACSPSLAELDAQATAIAADIFATQTAEVPAATQTPVPPTATPTLPATPTHTVVPTATATPTPTTRPTFTSIPQPAWITEFAEPILAAVAGRAPDYQDDFSNNKGKWKCPHQEWKLKFADGEMIVSNCHFSREMWYPDFVIEMEARFLSSRPEDEWRYHYRAGGGPNNFFDFEQNGDVEVGFEELGGTSKYVRLDDVLRPGHEVNHVLIIVKDQEVALFVNDRPIYYSVLEPRWKNGEMYWSSPVSGAYDNFKIWDITNLPIATEPAP